MANNAVALHAEEFEALLCHDAIDTGAVQRWSCILHMRAHAAPFTGGP